MQCNGKTGYRAGAVRDTVHLGQVLYLCVTLNFTLRMHRSSMYKKMYVEYALCKTKKNGSAVWLFYLLVGYVCVEVTISLLKNLFYISVYHSLSLRRDYVYFTVAASSRQARAIIPLQLRLNHLSLKTTEHGYC